MKVKSYMIPVYAVLVKAGKREVESLPEPYAVPVAEYLAAQEEGTQSEETKATDESTQTGNKATTK